LVAVGAVLRFAVSAQTNGFNVHTVGIILMVAGALAILLSLAFWSSWGGFHRRTVVDDSAGRRVVDERSSF
jgi:hypothetical protein